MVFDNDKILEIDPYILGCLLGDGCLMSTPSITTIDDFILNEFKKYFNSMGLELNPSSSPILTKMKYSKKNVNLKIL